MTFSVMTLPVTLDVNPGLPPASALEGGTRQTRVNPTPASALEGERGLQDPQCCGPDPGCPDPPLGIEGLKAASGTSLTSQRVGGVGPTLGHCEVGTENQPASPVPWIPTHPPGTGEKHHPSQGWAGPWSPASTDVISVLKVSREQRRRDAESAASEPASVTGNSRLCRKVPRKSLHEPSDHPLQGRHMPRPEK